MAESSGQAEVFARCAAVVDRALRAPVDDAELDAAVAGVLTLPPDAPSTAALAAGLVMAILRIDPARGPRMVHHLDGLLQIADRNPPPTPQWRRARSVARTLAIMSAGAHRRIQDPYAALREVDELAAEAGDDPGAQALFTSARTALDYVRAVQDGDDSAISRMPSEVAKLRDLAATMPGAGPTATVLGKLADLAAAQQRGDDVWSAFEEARRAVDGLPPGHQLHDVMRETQTLLAPLRAAYGSGDTPTPDQLAAVQALAERPGTSDAERALYYTSAGGAVLNSGGETDKARIDAGIASMRTAVSLSPPGDPQRAFHVWSLALGLWHRAEASGAFADLIEAGGLLEEARELAGGPGHPLWPQINEMLAHVQRRRGSTPDPRTSALDGLRHHAWNVLLQSDPAAVKRAAGAAVADAVDVAQLCLADSAPEDAIKALDAGRGLMLFAATELRDLTTRLDDAGRSDLSRRWREATASDPDKLPPDLRREVLTVLSTSAGVLDPPDLPQIRDALRTLDADALVYLVAGKAPAPGWAVIAPVDGPAGYMALTNLVTGAGLDVEKYLAALVSRDAAVRGPDESRDVGTVPVPGAGAGFLHSLDSLCDWAWRAAVGPLLEAFVGRRVTAPPGRLPRLILVPMGDLARIPWQAARRRDGTYAVQVAAISQAVSARTLCDSAARTPVPLTPVGLVVGDPDTATGDGHAAPPLRAARTEAHAVLRAFYRGARYVGRRADDSPSPYGAGTAAQVTDWLVTARPGAGAMLHLACHGFTSTGAEGATSYLLLAGGERLAAGDLIDLMAGSPRRGVGLVVLAACRTGLSIHGYDEAYSLGTAFLAGGARSVLSTQWSIPDRDTSVLMFMFHHFLMAERYPAWEALRRAQVWMLDAERVVPTAMPASLRDQLERTEPTRVSGWAGFVHWGQ